MDVIALDATSSRTLIPAEAIVCHDVRDPVERGHVLVRKGSLLRAADVDELRERSVAELHLAVPSPGDVGEDHAVTRLASTIAGTGVQVGKARFGQVTLVSSTRGLLRVNRDQLNQVNRLEGVLVMTGSPGCATDADANVAVVKCAPLFLPWQTLHAVEVLRDRDGPVVEVPGFCPRRIAFVAPADRLRGNAFERATTSLSTAVEWYGSSLDWVARAEPDVERLAEAFRDVVNAGAELLLIAGAAGTDPLDLVFEALRQAGGEVVQLGIPVEPGTACWIGSLDSRPVLGLASCELFGQPGALDLLLPRVLVGETLDTALLREIAFGGLLLGPLRVAPYHVATGS